MSHQNHHGQQSFDLSPVAGLRLGTMKQTLAGTLTMDRDMPIAHALDPGGATRVVLLPPEEEGLTFFIVNIADAAEDLTVKEDSNTTTIATVAGSVAGATNESGWFVCIGGVWRASVGANS